MTQKLNLGCGDDYKEDWVNIDIRKNIKADMVLDITDLPLPFENNSVSKIYMSHVLEHLKNSNEVIKECYRILENNGSLTLIIPFGTFWFTDPTHINYWTWETPDYFIDSQYPNYWNYNFRSVEKDIKDIWLIWPFNKLSPIIRILANIKPGKWCMASFWFCGEMKITFQK